MSSRSEHSAGVIPFRKENGKWKVFLIYQYGSGGDIFWTFPKGHPESEESLETAAERELLEETGLRLTKLYPDTQFTQSYTFIHDGVTIDKTVTYFLGVTDQTTWQIQESEVQTAGWFSLEEARTTITHEAAKQLFDEAVAVVVGL